jgi:two-component system, cell cycle sensor histidine kinase and response regulator CckA
MHQTVVLVADDEALVRNFAALVLQREQFVVIPACNGTEALQLCRIHDGIDLLLTDVQMGDNGMNGIELAVRVMAEKPGVKVLVMSGMPNTETIALDKGLPFLSKPFTLEDLTRRVREVLAVESSMPAHG